MASSIVPAEQFAPVCVCPTHGSDAVAASLPMTTPFGIVCSLLLISVCNQLYGPAKRSNWRLSKMFVAVWEEFSSASALRSTGALLTTVFAWMLLIIAFETFVVGPYNMCLINNLTTAQQVDACTVYRLACAARPKIVCDLAACDALTVRNNTGCGITEGLGSTAVPFTNGSTWQELASATKLAVANGVGAISLWVGVSNMLTLDFWTNLYGRLAMVWTVVKYALAPCLAMGRDRTSTKPEDAKSPKDSVERPQIEGMTDTAETADLGSRERPYEPAPTDFVKFHGKLRRFGEYIEALGDHLARIAAAAEKGPAPIGGPGPRSVEF